MQKNAVTYRHGNPIKDDRTGSHMAHVGENRNAQKVKVRKPK